MQRLHFRSPFLATLLNQPSNGWLKLVVIPRFRAQTIACFSTASVSTHDSTQPFQLEYMYRCGIFSLHSSPTPPRFPLHFQASLAAGHPLSTAHQPPTFPAPHSSQPCSRANQPALRMGRPFMFEPALEQRQNGGVNIPPEASPWSAYYPTVGRVWKQPHTLYGPTIARAGRTPKQPYYLHKET